MVSSVALLLEHKIAVLEHKSTGIVQISHADLSYVLRGGINTQVTDLSGLFVLFSGNPLDG